MARWPPFPGLPFVRQIWGALASLRPAKTKNLVFKKQVVSALHWLLTLADCMEGGLTRTVHAWERHLWTMVIVTDASPWGGGALMWQTWDSYQKDKPADEFMQLQWTPLHESPIAGQIGVPDR